MSLKGLLKKRASAPTWLWIVAVIAFVAGTYWRWVYIFEEHPPENNIYSDMAYYAYEGERFYQDDFEQKISHTVRPPGAAYLFGGLRHLDIETVHLPENRLADIPPQSLALLAAWKDKYVVLKTSFGRDRPGTLAEVTDNGVRIQHRNNGHNYPWHQVKAIRYTSGKTATNVSFWIAVLIPLAVAWLGFELFGTAVALLGSTMANLHFPFVDYAGYYLAESPFTLGIVLVMALLMRSLRVRSGWLAALFALITGTLLGLTATLKSVALLSAAFVGLTLLAVLRKYRFRRLAIVALATLIGVGAALAPFAMRCTKLRDGQFCLIATEASLNFYLGHHGRIYGARFHDASRNMTHTFSCPVAVLRGYKGTVNVPAGAYESSKLRELTWEWIKEHKTEALLLSIDHIFDNFTGLPHWPSSHGKHLQWVLFFIQVYWVFILLPALLHLYLRRRAIWRLETDAIGDLLTLVPIFGLVVASFIAKGEPRYRIPFDPFMMLLAARCYLSAAPRSNPFRLLPRRASASTTEPPALPISVSLAADDITAIAPTPATEDHRLPALSTPTNENDTDRLDDESKPRPETPGLERTPALTDALEPSE